MTTETNTIQSIFPDYPRQINIADKDGVLTAQWDLGLSSLFQALQANYKSEGILFPPLTATNMTAIQNLYASFVGGSYATMVLSLPDISGQTVFDTTTKFTNQFVIAQDGSGNVTLAEWVPLAVLLTNPGNPNTVVAGVLNWLCLDTTNKVLYACTTAGSAAAAVWTSV